MPQNYADQKKLIGLKIRHFDMMPNVPLRLTLLCGFTRPKGGTGRNKYPTVYKDGDNLLKSVMDAMNGILYEDDCLICEIEFKKQYSDHDYIHVTLSEVDNG